MKFIQGEDRTQTHLFPVSLDLAIDPDNEVRLIDLFVDSLDLGRYGFKTHFVENGRPAYHPADLLKLFIYGYLNKTRSSRDLEKACKVNIEAMWLLNSLSPDHNTISNFRRDNPKAIKNVFRATVNMAKHFNLIGGKLIAGDSTKFRAQNSKKNNFNPKKVKRHMAYIDHKLAQYNQALATADDDEKKKIEKDITKHNNRKDGYNKLAKELDESGQTQISTADPDSRNLMLRNNICEVAYSAQTTVDAKHKLPIDYLITNTNDTKAMGPMLARAIDILETNTFTALYDKGYYDGPMFKQAEDLGIKAIVAVRGLASSSRAPDERYNVQHFRYNADNDCYTCPENHVLSTNGSWYKSPNGKFKQYKTKACKGCKARALCTSAKNGKIISRSAYARYYKENQERFNQNKELYTQRQAIVEHPYGTIKRQWGFSYISTKRGMQKASADVGLMFTAYNLRRLMNIIGLKPFIKYLKVLVAFLMIKIDSCRGVLSQPPAPKFYSNYLPVFTINSPKRLIFT